MKRLFFVFIDVVIAGNDIDRCDAVAVFQSLEDDALAGSCLLAGDLAGLCLDGDALFGYTDEFIIVISGYESDDFVPLLEVADTASVSSLEMVCGGLVSLRIAVSGNREDILIRSKNCAYDFVELAVVIREADCMDTCGSAAHRADFIVSDGEADSHALTGADDDFLITLDSKDSDETVAIIQTDSDQAVLVDVLVFGNFRLLDIALLRDHEQVLHILIACIDIEELGHPFIRSKTRDEVDESAASCRSARLREFDGCLHVDFALVREEEDPVMSGGAEELPDIVLILHLHAGYAAAALSLDADISGIHAFDIVLLCQRNRHRFIRDEIGHRKIVRSFSDFRTAFIAEVLLLIEEFILDYAHQLVTAGEEIGQVINRFQHILIILFQLVAFQTGQSSETHIEDRGSLFFRKAEFFHQGSSCDVVRAGLSDRTDDFIDMIKSDQQAFQNVGFGLCLVQFILRSSGDDFFLMLQVVVQDLAQIQDTRMSVNERQHDSTEVDLHLCMLEEIVQHDFRVHVSAELDSNTHARSVGFIAQSRDAVQDLLSGQVGDCLNEARLVDLVRNFRYDDTVLAMRHFFDIRSGTDSDAAAAGAVRVFDALVALDDSSRREIRGP